MSAGRSKWIEGLVIVAAVFATLGVLHPELVFQKKIYASSDMRSAAAFKHLGDLALENGEYPLWNPYVFAGMPSYASLAYTPDVYPLTKPLRVTAAALRLPPMAWLLFHLFLAGVFTAAYARWRGISLPAAALAGALIVAVPNVAAWSAYGHGTKVGTFAWLPLALWCTEGLMRTGRLPFLFGLAAALTMQLLRGHVQIVYYTAITLAICVVFQIVKPLRDPERRAETLRRLGMLAAAGALALAAAMVLYLPVLDYQGHSIRGATSQGGGAAYEYATSWSLPPGELDTLWWPTAAGYGRASYVGGMPFTDYPNYVGGPILLLAALGLALRRDRWAWALATVALLATLVSLGRHGPVYDLFYHVLPGFKKFRVPVMILILQQLAVILLAVAGLDRVVRIANGDETRPRWLGPPAALAVAVAGVALLLWGTLGASALRESSLSAWQSMRAGVPVAVLAPVADIARADAVRLGIVLALTALALVLTARRRIPPLAAAVGVAVLLVVDYVAVDQPLLRPEKHLVTAVREGDRMVTVPSPGLVRDESAVREFVAGNSLTEWLRLQGDRPRVWPLGEWSANNLFAGQEIVSLGGYHAVKLKTYEEIRSRLYDPQEPRWRLANLLAAEYVAAPFELNDAAFDALSRGGVQLERQPVFRSADGAIYRNSSALPRAWVVGAYEAETPGEDRTSHEPETSVLDRTLHARFDPRAVAILSDVPVPVPRTGAATGRVEIVSEGAHWLELSVETPEPGVLVVADIFYPDWNVTVDGNAARLLRANYALRAVALEAGAHTVEFRFRSPAYERGKAISRASGTIIGLGLVGSLALGVWRRRRGGSE
jgi:hypothetical protein